MLDRLVIVVMAVVCLLGCRRPVADHRERQREVASGAGQNVWDTRNVLADAQDAIRSTGRYSREAKEQLQIRFQEGLHAVDQQMERLRRRGDQLTGRAREDFQEAMERAERERERLDDKLTRLRNATVETWEQAKEDVGTAWNDLHSAMEDVQKKASRDF